MELTLLTVPACPNAARFEERLAAALDGRLDVVLHRRVVANEQEAVEAGMHGSPTLLVDGVDPFATPGQAPRLSCRLYRDESGRAEGAPSRDALWRAIGPTEKAGPPVGSLSWPAGAAGLAASLAPSAGARVP